MYVSSVPTKRFEQKPEVGLSSHVAIVLLYVVAYSVQGSTRVYCTYSQVELHRKDASSRILPLWYITYFTTRRILRLWTTYVFERAIHEMSMGK